MVYFDRTMIPCLYNDKFLMRIHQTKAQFGPVMWEEGESSEYLEHLGDFSIFFEVYYVQNVLSLLVAVPLFQKLALFSTKDMVNASRTVDYLCGPKPSSFLELWEQTCV